MASPSLHKLVLRSDLCGLKEALDSRSEGIIPDIDAYDQGGFTPLMHAVKNPNANVEIVRLLLDQGADFHLKPRSDSKPENVMALALGGGDPATILLLIQRGDNIHYQRSNGYGALIDAVHSRDILHDTRLIDLLKLLIAEGAALSDVTSYGESGLRVLSRIGRFDAVKLLLDAGADPSHLEWTPLMRAVALGTLPEVESEANLCASLEDRDRWQRTAWLIAIQTGGIAKAQFLYDAGANTGARGRCGTPATFYAIQNHHFSMLNWLLAIGASIEETDDFGTTPLMAAVEANNLQAVKLLLKSGVLLASERDGQSALSFASTREIAECLLNAGSNPAHLSFEARRALLGLEPEPDAILFEASPGEFRKGSSPRFGITNPHRFDNPFYEAMIRSGIDAYQTENLFPDIASPENPVWSARRFGQSISFLPDGRIIQIGGEHEDSYDPNFCIYNDVFVHQPGGAIELYGYPEQSFPPTDFHTATLIDGLFIWIIGSLGYSGARRHGETPVYRLNTKSYQMERMTITGEPPGWIYGHTAEVLPGKIIRLSGGKIASLLDGEETHIENDRSFFLNTERGTWSAA